MTYPYSATNPWSFGAGGTGPAPSGFDAAAYLQSNQDVAKNALYGSNPYQHYMDWGKYEGRSMASPPGLSTVGGAPIGWFDPGGAGTSAGANPPPSGTVGGAPIGWFDPGGPGTSTINKPIEQQAPYPYTAATPWQFGIGKESPGAMPKFFDAEYLSRYGDVASNQLYGANPYQHYLDWGRYEGRDRPIDAIMSTTDQKLQTAYAGLMKTLGIAGIK